MKHEQKEVLDALMAVTLYAPKDAEYNKNVGILTDYIVDVVNMLNQARKENEALAKALLQVTNHGVNNREGRRKLKNAFHVDINDNYDEIPSPIINAEEEVTDEPTISTDTTEESGVNSD